MILQTILSVLPQIWFLVFLGFIAGRILKVPLEATARLVLFLIVPLGNFGAIARIDFTLATLMLPVLGFALAAACAYIAYFAARLFYTDNNLNLIGMASSTGNTGYFGIPIVLALYGYEVIGYYFMVVVGVIMCEVTIGYYIGNRGQADIRTSLIRVAKLPILYGTVAGILWSASGYDLGAPVISLWEKFMAAYSVLGMMIVGIALGQMTKFQWDTKLFSWLLGVKFLLWPVLAGGFLILGAGAFMASFDPRLPLLFILIASVPLAGNTPAYAAMTGLHPDKAAVATLVSTLVSIVTIPATLWIAERFIL